MPATLKHCGLQQKNKVSMYCSFSRRHIKCLRLLARQREDLGRRSSVSSLSGAHINHAHYTIVTRMQGSDAAKGPIEWWRGVVK